MLGRNELYLLVSRVTGITAEETSKVLSEFETAEDALSDMERSKTFLSIFAEQRKSIVSKVVNRDNFCRFTENLSSNGVYYRTINSDDYPKCLFAAENPPTVIYYKGDEKLFSAPAVGVVGSRRCSSYGLDMTKRFCRDFAASGLTVVSGLALGIDTAAHSETLKCGGKTVAVVAGGLNHVYPKENEGLYGAIAENGLLVSLYSPETPIRRFMFPMRNEFISAISDGVLIVEAGANSGALITADYAKKQGKKLYVIPGNLNSPFSVGSNSLIKKCPSSFVLAASDIISDIMEIELGECGNAPEAIDEDSLSEDEKLVMQALRLGLTEFDEMMQATKMDYFALTETLFGLEIMGIIKKVAGNNYVV